MVVNQRQSSLVFNAQLLVALAIHRAEFALRCVLIGRFLLLARRTHSVLTCKPALYAAVSNSAPSCFVTYIILRGERFSGAFHTSYLGIIPTDIKVISRTKICPGHELTLVDHLVASVYHIALDAQCCVSIPQSQMMLSVSLFRHLPTYLTDNQHHQ